MRTVYYFDKEGKIMDRPTDKTGPRLHVIQDSMDACVHPATGVWCDSKSEFRRMTKASGCIEVGNESQAHVEKNRPKLSPARYDLLRALGG